MIRPSVGIALVLLLGQSAASRDKTCPLPEAVKDSKFRPGQVWEYKTRSGEEKSSLTVLRVESLPKVGTVIHVRVDNVRLKNCTGGPEPNTIEHMPFIRDAVERSVTKLLKEGSGVPDFRAGYDEWRKACGGAYSVAVSEAVELDEVTLRKNLGCGSSN